MTTLSKENILMAWFFWHFYEMPKFLLEVWKNYILFALNYFSLPLLFRSLISPWRRYRWNYPKAFDVGEFFSTLISNVFSRFLGFLMRIVLICVGVVFQAFVILIGFIIFLLWVLLPAVILAGFFLVFIY